MMKQPYGSRLIELLHNLDPAYQVRFTTESRMYAYYYCNRYDIHLKEFEDAAYFYKLGKYINEHLRKQDMFSDVAHTNISDSYEITKYYHERFTWLLNETIKSRYVDMLCNDDIPCMPSTINPI